MSCGSSVLHEGLWRHCSIVVTACNATPSGKDTPAAKISHRLVKWRTTQKRLSLGQPLAHSMLTALEVVRMMMRVYATTFGLQSELPLFQRLRRFLLGLLVPACCSTCTSPVPVISCACERFGLLCAYPRCTWTCISPCFCSCE